MKSYSNDRPMNHSGDTSVRKVFIGCTDIASLIQEFRTGFAALGIETFTVVHQQSVIQGSAVDINVGASLPRAEWFSDATTGDQVRAIVRNELTQFAWNRAMSECDTFLFLWNSFTPDFRDLLELRQLGKRIVWWFLGEDSRWRGAFDEEMRHYGLAPLRYAYPLTADALTQRLLRLRWAELLSDAVFNTPSQAGLALRPYYDALPYPLNVARIEEGREQRERPVVVHAPSSRDKKGTTEILGVLEELHREGIDFDLELIENLPHAAAMERYRNADVLVGQLYGVTLGRQDRELLAQGRVVVGGISAGMYPQRLPEDFPAVPAHTPDQLRNVLRRILPGAAERRAIAARGRPFVAHYHDPARACRKILDVLAGDSEPDFIPEFFRNSFTPEEELLPVYNATNELVSPAEWYKSGVAKGERAGLRF